MRFQDYSAKPSTPMMDIKAPRKREPTPFAGNHVVDLEAMKKLVPSDTKRSALGEDSSVPPVKVKSPFVDPEVDRVGDEPMF
jgi:hypothetical protein